MRVGVAQLRVMLEHIQSTCCHLPAREAEGQQ
jgi:hypothetical protein